MLDDAARSVFAVEGEGMEFLIVVLIAAGALYFWRYSQNNSDNKSTSKPHVISHQASGRSSSGTPSSRTEKGDASSFNLAGEVEDTSDERDLLRQLWEASTLNFAVYGPGSVEELAQLIRRRAPSLRGTLWGRHQILSVEEPRLSLYGAFLTGATGSAFLLTEATSNAPTDTERMHEIFPVVEHIGEPTPTADGSGTWKTTLFTLGSTNEAELADIVLNSKVHPIGIAGGFVDAASSGFPEELGQDLLESGWGIFAERPELTIFAINTETAEGRTQVVLFGNEGPDTLRWNSAIAASPERYQEFLDANIDLPEGYELEAPTPENEKGWVVLRTELRQDLTVREVNKVAIEIAAFADRVEADLWGDDQL